MNTKEFELQRLMKKILWSDSRYKELEQCCRGFHKTEVSLRRSIKSGKVRSFEVRTCGRFWLCAVCSAKIAYRRQKQIEQALIKWRERGGSCIHLTLTVPHHHDRLEWMLPILIKAFDRFKKKKAYKDLTKRWGIRHHIRRLEITYSFKNGFHPHLHVFLLATESEEALMNSQEDEPAMFSQAWAEVCKAVGLKPSSIENGVQVVLKDNPVQDARYIMKDGYASDEPKELNSTAPQHSLTIWDLLWLHKAGDKRVARVIEEYASATYYRQSFRPSNDLMNTLQIVDSSDTEILRGYEQDWEIILRLTSLEKQLVSRYGILGRLIAAAEEGGQEAIRAILDEYRDKDLRASRFPIYMTQGDSDIDAVG